MATDKVATLTPETVKAVYKLLEKNKAQIAAACPKHINAGKLIRSIQNSMQSNPKLFECTPASIMQAAMQAAEVGLEVGSVLGHAFLIPRYNGRTKKMEAKMQVGYKGLIALAMRSKEVISIQARVVLEGDKFERIYGLEENLIHVPKENNIGAAITHAYCIARIRGAEAYPLFDVMTRDEIEAIRKRSQNPDGIWASDYGEMSKKTVLRRLIKLLPVSAELQGLAALDEAVELGYDEPRPVKPVKCETMANEKTKELADKYEAAAAIEPEPNESIPVPVPDEQGEREPGAEG